MFQDIHQAADINVAIEAGMLSATNLKEFDTARLQLTVEPQQTKASNYLAADFRWHGKYDGQIIDTTTPQGAKHLAPDRVMQRHEPVRSAGE